MKRMSYVATNVKMIMNITQMKKQMEVAVVYSML
jgi:hypothetical protein